MVYVYVVGLVKLMGRQSGCIAMQASMASCVCVCACMYPSCDVCVLERHGGGENQVFCRAGVHGIRCVCVNARVAGLAELCVHATPCI